jgi:hypothetical protein
MGRKLYGQLLPKLHGLPDRAKKQDALQDLTGIHLALYRYRAAHGNWPATLGELVPNYLASLTVDPFVPPRSFGLFGPRPKSPADPTDSYRYQPDKAIVYSVGSDRKDDVQRGWDWHQQKGAPRDIVVEFGVPAGK